jgi:hypothetical protein
MKFCVVFTTEGCQGFGVTFFGLRHELELELVAGGPGGLEGGSR